MSEFSKTFLRDRIGDDERPGGKLRNLRQTSRVERSYRGFAIADGEHGHGQTTHVCSGHRLANQFRSVDAARGKCLPARFRPRFLVGARAAISGRQDVGFARWQAARALPHGRALSRNQHATGSRGSVRCSGRLEQVAAGCRAARSAEAVKDVIAGVANGSAVALEEPGPEARSTLNVVRGSVLKFARDLRGNLPPRCRLPAEPRDISRSLRFWSRICASLAPEDLPLLFLAPLRTPWIDVLAREPAQGQFFCLRAGLPAAPLTYPPEPLETVEELDADELVKAALDGKPPAGRSWFSRMIGH